MPPRARKNRRGARRGQTLAGRGRKGPPARRETTVKMKRWIAFALCAVLALSLTACKFSAPSTVMTVDGTEIPAGIYLAYQRQAYYSAQSLREDAKVAVLKSSIEGMKAADWIHAETVDNIRQYIWVEQAFEEAGLSFTQEELDAAEQWLDTMWSYSGALMEENGVGRQSYRLVYLNGEKYTKLLEAYRAGPDGEITETQAKEYMQKTYSRIRRLILPATDADSAALTPEKQAELDALADSLAERLNAGEKLEEAAEEALKQAYEICGREYTEDSLSSDLGAFFISEETTGFEEDFVPAVMAAAEGDAGVYQNNTAAEGVSQPVVYQKIANYEDDDDFNENYYEILQTEMTGAAFAEKMEAEYAAYAVQEDGFAVWSYRPSNIRESA